jgi:hypothetical protein
MPGMVSSFRCLPRPSAEDLDLFQVIDSPGEVVDAIFDYDEHRSFEPSEQEQEKLLELQAERYAETNAFPVVPAGPAGPAGCRGATAVGPAPDHA